ncbi:hypothetical protein AAHE18_06G189900 [Arachis hypogaea]
MGLLSSGVGKNEGKNEKQTLSYEAISSSIIKLKFQIPASGISKKQSCEEDQGFFIFVSLKVLLLDVACKLRELWPFSLALNCGFYIIQISPIMLPSLWIEGV